MKILNLTQHLATEDQVAAGVVNLPERTRKLLSDLITFEDIPSEGEMAARAEAVCKIAFCWWSKTDPSEKGVWSVMLGGAPWFMPDLVGAFRHWDIHLLFAFSRRESVDETQPDGSVRKISTFKHSGFVEVT